MRVNHRVYRADRQQGGEGQTCHARHGEQSEQSVDKMATGQDWAKSQCGDTSAARRQHEAGAEQSPSQPGHGSRLTCLSRGLHNHQGRGDSHGLTETETLTAHCLYINCNSRRNIQSEEARTTSCLCRPRGLVGPNSVFGLENILGKFSIN